MGRSSPVSADSRRRPPVPCTAIHMRERGRTGRIAPAPLGARRSWIGLPRGPVLAGEPASLTLIGLMLQAPFKAASTSSPWPACVRTSAACIDGQKSPLFRARRAINRHSSIVAASTCEPEARPDRLRGMIGKRQSTRPVADQLFACGMSRWWASVGGKKSVRKG